MKIKKLRLKNLNSLYGEWSIDFRDSEFQTNPIFAITGPTGAGKTTLLDAITLALYGKTARMGSVTKSANEIMSKGESECFAEVEFSEKGKDYRVFWEQKRARKKSDGALQETRHELSELGGKVLASLKSEVQTQIKNICGMDFERFLRSMLLAQGRFSDFLFADAAERSPILEQITGTQIYSEISVSVFERAKQENEKLDAEQKLADTSSLLAEQERIDKQNFSKKTGEEIDALNRKKKSLQELLSKINDRNNLLSKLEKCDAETAAVIDRQKAFAERERFIKRAESALSLESDWINLDVSEKSNAAEAKKKTLCESKIPSFCKDFSQAAEKEKAFADSLEILKSETKSALENIAKARIGEGLLESARNAYCTAKREYLQEEEILKKQKSEIEKLALKKSEIEKQLSDTRRQSENFSAEKILSDFRKLLEDAIENEAFAARAANYKQDRKELLHGKACPLCGSTEHPYSENPPDKEAETSWRKKVEESAVSAEKFAGATSEKLPREKSGECFSNLSRQDLLNNLQQKCAKLSQLQAKEESLKNELSNLDILINEKSASLQNGYVRLKSHSQNLDSIKKDADALRQKRYAACAAENLQEEEVRVEKKLETQERNFEKLKNETVEKKQALENLKMQIAAINENLEKNSEGLKKLGDEFGRKIQESIFENIQDFLSARISQSELDCIKKERDEIAAAKIVQQTLRARLVQMLSQFEIDSEVSAENTANSIEDIDSDISQKMKIRAETDALLERDKQLRIENALHIQRIEKLRKTAQKWDRLKSLIGSADGKKFRAFAQGITFDIMIAHANSVLSKMSARYLLVRDKTEPLTLCVIDNYQGGEMRSVKNLSGGESFIVSLALALGFSDMSAANLAVESLFLDEGFGTLDESSLNAAVDTLANLGTSRQIGIISHVEALKERIATRINVEPYALGRSKLIGAGCKRL